MDRHARRRAEAQLDMNIRAARRDEIPVFRTLELAAARAFDDIGHGWIAALEPLPSNEVAAVLNSGGAFLALDDAERPIGFAVAHWLGDDIVAAPLRRFSALHVCPEGTQVKHDGVERFRPNLGIIVMNRLNDPTIVCSQVQDF